MQLALTRVEKMNMINYEKYGLKNDLPGHMMPLIWCISKFNAEKSQND